MSRSGAASVAVGFAQGAAGAEVLCGDASLADGVLDVATAGGPGAGLAAWHMDHGRRTGR